MRAAEPEAVVLRYSELGDSFKFASGSEPRDVRSCTVAVRSTGNEGAPQT